MPIIFIVTFAVQIFFLAHATQTGRERIWVYLLLLAPGVGSLLYFVTQFWPEFSRSREGTKIKAKVKKAIDPQGDLRKREDALSISDTVANRLTLADEYIENHRYEEALECLQGARSGLYRHSPEILSRIARARFAMADFTGVVQVLDELIAENPDYKSHDDHLLYARALTSAGRTQEALDEFRVLNQCFPGEEAKIHYADLLKASGRTEEAMEVYQNMLKRARIAPKFYVRKEKKWLNMARQMSAE